MQWRRSVAVDDDDCHATTPAVKHASVAIASFVERPTVGAAYDVAVCSSWIRPVVSIS